MKTLASTQAVATPRVISQMSSEAQKLINQAKKSENVDYKRAQANDLPKDEKDEKPEKSKKSEKTPKVTKKQIVIEMISKEGGSLISDIAQTIVDRGIDNDLEKNKRVVRLWLSKLGMPVRRLEDGHYVKGE